MAQGKFLSAALAGLLVLGGGAAAAATHPVRVRGEIARVHGNALHITTYSKHHVDLRLTDKTHYTLVVPAHLSDIKSGEFVGIGATGPKAHLKALEVVIFPRSMRGTGEGHYPWSLSATVANADLHHAATGSSAGAPPVKGTMTNGTVAGISAPSGAPPVRGSMTNGTVASSNGTPGGRQLTVTYDHGEKVRILVPSNAPVVQLQVASRSVLKRGAKTFAVATGPSSSKLRAIVVAVGKNGLMPPM